VRPLQRKLLRDLWRLRAQGLAVVTLLAIGVGLMVAALGMRGSLQQARDDYYQRNLLADLQVQLVRAPRRLAETIALLPDVQTVDARAAAAAVLDLGGISEPVTARLLSLDDPASTPVNRPWLVRGRWPAAGAAAEVVINEAFADAHQLALGSPLPAHHPWRARTAARGRSGQLAGVRVRQPSGPDVSTAGPLRGDLDAAAPA
jgi:putative ABC transport system permease protein